MADKTIGITTCKDCKHWDNAPQRHRRDRPNEWGTCMAIPAAWLATNSRQELEAPFEDLKAAVADADDYMADLFTAPEFFCYHGEGR